MQTKKLLLQTPEGEQSINIEVTIDSDNMDNAKTAVLKTRYLERDIIAIGTEYPWMDAYVSLQKQLPSDVTIKGCISCRHGNMCPAGNSEDELFCTHDVIISKRSDLFFYTEDINERVKRSRHYTDHCEYSVPQSNSHFTYTDFSVNNGAIGLFRQPKTV